MLCALSSFEETRLIWLPTYLSIRDGKDIAGNIEDRQFLFLDFPGFERHQGSDDDDVQTHYYHGMLESMYGYDQLSKYTSKKGIKNEEGVYLLSSTRLPAIDFRRWVQTQKGTKVGPSHSRPRDECNAHFPSKKEVKVTLLRSPWA